MRREAFNVELPEMERRWLLEEEERRRRIPWRIFFLFLVVMVSSGVITAVVKTAVPGGNGHRHQLPPPPRFNYTEALKISVRFFNAQKAGKLPEDGNYTESAYKDLTGGFYDDGTATKSSKSMSFSLTLLSWSVIEYSSTYQASGELQHVRSIIKWGTDYMLKTFDSKTDSISELVVQVGSPEDGYCWMRPEDIRYRREAITCFSGCAHFAAETAASLAAASIVFKDDLEYSLILLQGAKTVFKFALSMKDRKSEDDLLWGGIWLYFATGHISYLDRVTSSVSAGPSSYVFSSERKLLGTQMLLTRLRLFIGPGYPYEEGLRQSHHQASRAMCAFLPSFTTLNRTTGGLILFRDQKPLEYAANAAFIASLYSEYLEAAGIPGWYCGDTFYKTQLLRDFSTSQVEYILGKNPQNMSYVVGFGERYPRHVHHRGASIPKNQKPSCNGGWKWRDSEKADPNTIEGAMVAGPDNHDGFQDVRVLKTYTEPSLSGNAGLVSALVAVSEGRVDKNGIFVALTPTYAATPPPPSPWTP